ncbi:uncharacterized protein N7511_002975 [Penicillium nucicola]|uniref:uncharacterized protein n=1 Tax=Penicillium nucicola TaxID=1850975 RepID=UPI0025455FBC|nr:uncharacterized protein N7511_002975 [Penicillium nucicola]KAJ5770924.1 hypothetical protein N7511_002975 [Penicillium nucicola]
MDDFTPPDSNARQTQPHSTNRQQVIAPELEDYSPAEDPGHHLIDTPLTVPAGEAGAEEIQPSMWATYVKQLPWKVARHGKFIKTDAIKMLKEAPSRREPVQRSSTGYTGKRLDERIGTQAANVESVLIQIVGETSYQECTNCLKNNGPWAHCIRYDNINWTVSAGETPSIAWK